MTEDKVERIGTDSAISKPWPDTYTRVILEPVGSVWQRTGSVVGDDPDTLFDSATVTISLL